MQPSRASSRTLTVGDGEGDPETTNGRRGSSAVGAVGAVEPSATRALRVTLAVLSLGSLLLGTSALALGADDLRLVSLLVFAVLGVGSAPWQLQPRIGGYERLTLVFLTAAAVLTVAPLLLRFVGLWHPGVAFGGVAAIVLPLHVEGLLRVRQEVRASTGGTAWPSPWVPLAVDRDRARAAAAAGLPATATATLGAALCIGAALAHRDATPGFYGFLPDIGPVWYAGVLLLLLALALRRWPEHSKALPVLLLSSVLTLTPALVYDTPRSQSAAKHVDFVQYIQANGELASAVAVYNSYAGFFDAIAWLSSVSGSSDPIWIATLWPFLIGVIRVLVLRYLFGQVLATSAQCWVAVTAAVLMDTIGADYFSPQSLGFVLAMATVGVALTRNGVVPRLPLVLAGGVALTVSHQLSPYVTGGVLVVLVVFGLLRPWWTPGLVLGAAAAWALIQWDAVSSFLTLDAFGRLGNFQPPATGASTTLERLPVVGHTVWATVGGILLVGCLTLVTLFRRRRDVSTWALAACPAVGVALVIAQPYGQEGVFRAALFGIPWVAALAAPVLAGSRIRDRGVLLVVTSILTGTYLVGSFGLDGTNVIRPADLAAVRHVESLGAPRPPNPYYLLVLNAGDHPTTPEYEDDSHFIWSRTYIELPPGEENATVAELTDTMVRYTDDDEAELYALWSPAGARYGDAYAIQSAEEAEELRDAFLVSPYWSVDRAVDGTYLFRFERDRYPGG